MTDKKSTMQKAVGVARAIAENEPDEDALALLAATLDSSRSIATGQTSADDIGVEFAAEAVEFFGDVVADPGHPFGPLWRDVARQVVRLGLIPAHVLEDALRAMRGQWVADDDTPTPPRTLPPIAGPDALDEVEPWDQDEPQVDEQAVPQAQVPPSPQKATEADQDVIVEVEQETSSQRRYRMPAGSYYSPSTSPLARPIGGGRRPVIEIRTDVPGLDDQ